MPLALVSAAWASRTAGLLEVACGAEFAVDRLALAVATCPWAMVRLERASLNCVTSDTNWF